MYVFTHTAKAVLGLCEAVVDCDLLLKYMHIVSLYHLPSISLEVTAKTTGSVTVS